jgi:hypothetical protein
MLFSQVQVFEERDVERVNDVGMKCVELVDEFLDEVQDVTCGTRIPTIGGFFKTVPERCEIEMDETFSDLAAFLFHPWKPATHPRPDFGFTK